MRSTGVKGRAAKAVKRFARAESVGMFQEIQPFKRLQEAAENDGIAPVAVRDRQRKRLDANNWLFLLTVVVPTVAAIMYYGFLASDIYVSESKFVIRSPDKPAATGLGVILRSAGFANAGDELSVA